MSGATGKKESANDWADTLRAAVSTSELSQYAIAQAAGIQRSQLSRFMAGEGIGLATAQAIGRVVGCDLVRRKS